MKPTQDPKYGIDNEGRLCNIASGEPIPEDEPIFIFRAKDMLAENALHYYVGAVTTNMHKEAIHARIKDFQHFRQQNPTRMKAPDTVFPFPKGE